MFTAIASGNYQQRAMDIAYLSALAEKAYSVEPGVTAHTTENLAKSRLPACDNKKSIGARELLEI